MKDFFELMLRVEQRPGMYMRHKTMTVLEAFIDGMSVWSGFRLEKEGSAQTLEEDLASQMLCGEFERWIVEALGAKQYYRYSTALLEHTGSETEAFDLFFKMMHQFMEMKGLSK